MHAWLVFECGTLAADPAAGTLGFGILEIDGPTVTARPIRVGADGSFTTEVPDTKRVGEPGQRSPRRVSLQLGTVLLVEACPISMPTK